MQLIHKNRDERALKTQKHEKWKTLQYSLHAQCVVKVHPECTFLSDCSSSLTAEDPIYKES